MSILSNFNPRSDERSDHCQLLSTWRVLNFNPRSDERSDKGTCSFWHSRQISIHAPTNGATGSDFCSSPTSYISIHAPTNGATILSAVTNQIPKISIHAPTNGATAILHKKMKKTIQNRLIILLFSTNSLRLLCSCTQYSFFLFIFHGANDLVILCSLSFRTTSKN